MELSTTENHRGNEISYAFIPYVSVTIHDVLRDIEDPSWVISFSGELLIVLNALNRLYDQLLSRGHVKTNV